VDDVSIQNKDDLVFKEFELKIVQEKLII